jgi:hypothetical protein
LSPDFPGEFVWQAGDNDSTIAVMIISNLKDLIITGCCLFKLNKFILNSE